MKFSLADVPFSTSIKIPTSSRDLKTGFMQVVSKMDKEKAARFLDQVRKLFDDKLVIEYEIGRLYLFKVTGKKDKYDKLRATIKDMKDKNEASIKELESNSEWKLSPKTWGDIPFFGDYELSKISEFPKFNPYTAKELGYSEVKFGKFVHSALSIFSNNIKLDKYFGKIYAAKFSGNDDKVAAIQDDLKVYRELSDAEVVDFKKDWGKNFKDIPFFGDDF